MKTWGRVVLVVATGLAVGAAVLLWQHGQPRREAVLAVSKLADNLANHRGSELLETIVIPAAIRSQTPGEQQEFITKALADEISPDGVLAMKQHAEYGPAKSIFPAEIATWCQQAGVNSDDCVAFKMERAFEEITAAGGLAEAVVVHCGTKPFEDSHDAAYRQIDKLLAVNPRPTAIFTVSDAGAWAALRRLSELGISVPQEISVLGFSDDRPSRFMHPALSTIAQPVAEIARRAIEMLVENQPGTRVEFMPPSLVIRESTAVVTQDKSA